MRSRPDTSDRDIDLTPEASEENLARLSSALKELDARIRTEAVPDGLPFSHDATSLAADVWNLICPDGEFDISFHPSGFEGGRAQLAVNAHRLRVGEVEVIVAEVVARAILSVPGATLRVMDTLSNISDTSYEIPLSDADQTALRPALLHDLGTMPFESGALISRSLWVIFIGEWGVWTHAVLPVDDRLDMPDRKSITGLCDLVGSLMSPPLCHDDEKAMIVLRRPGPAEISEADAYIFRLVRQAAIGRETAPWTFHVVGPDGIREVTEHEAAQDTAD